MTNNTWRKLCNEWNANKFNEEFIALCNRIDILYDDITALRSEDMQWIRKQCKSNYVWLEDLCESNLYVEYMPMGGYTRKSLDELKNILKQYRNSGRSNITYQTLMGRR